MKKSLQILAIVAITVLLGAVSRVTATQWNDRTILKFSEPVMVPEATLEPGSYVFKLVSSESNRHIVEILDQDSNEVVTITQAIPMRRMDAKGDVVVKLNPTEPGTPPAIEAWFYPGTRYGHRFIYPDDQAREIAQRTKTIVLSGDIEGSDRSRGTLYTYDASGTRGTWQDDESVNREWQKWQRDSAAGATADVHTPPPAGRAESTAPMIQGSQPAMEVPIDDLEESTRKYIGKTVSVDGEVEEVLGPRIFAIDEPDWGDLDGELLVFMPTHLVALVQDDDRVTVTGTVKQFVRADFEREWGWFDMSPELEAELALKPVIVADRIVGGNNNVALVIERSQAEGSGTGGTPVGTTGTAEATAEVGGPMRGATIESLGELADARRSMIGRHVDLDGVSVTAMSEDGRGFFVRSEDGTSVFVLPAREQADVKANSRISIDGVILQMPSRMRQQLEPSGDWNDAVYVLATDIQS